SMAAGVGLACAPRTLLAATGPDNTPDTVVMLLNLEGGPDFRHVFVPPYDVSNPYSTSFWQARAFSHELKPEDLTGQESRASEYLLPENPQHQYFGIHPNCGWLKDMFDQGNVALINNVGASVNRDHSHSTLILESANTESNATDREQSGWGGRLAHECNRNIVSVTRAIRLVCYGPHDTDPNSHDNVRVISAEDSRNMGLYEFEGYGEGDWQWSRRGHMSRALSTYYAAKAEELPKTSRYWPVIQREQSQRLFGRLMRDSLYGRLVGDALDNVTVPPELRALYTENSGNELTSHPFGQQMANIYDVMHALNLLDANIISADYIGWDHHRALREKIEPALLDIFGTGKGLDTLFTQLGPLADKLIVLVYGEFGRQLAANGDGGIDHGIGNTMMLLGTQVNGGVYGEMFPEAEYHEGLFTVPSADIAGRTSFKQLLGQVCEKLCPGGADKVIPGWSATDLEDGVNLSNLFS
ncbi:MAG: DUF1501 domain-containing protein, partial [Myxococcota bacterium]|nr:DUF1501 domain-containing protein [Myxococcota bacterium]